MSRATFANLREAGFALGNHTHTHTHSHRAYSKMTSAAFIDDVVRNERALKRIVGAFLRKHYYGVAPFSTAERGP